MNEQIFQTSPHPLPSPRPQATSASSRWGKKAAVHLGGHFRALTVCGCGAASSSPTELVAEWGHSMGTAFHPGLALAKIEPCSGQGVQDGHQKESFWGEVILE